MRTIFEKSVVGRRAVRFDTSEKILQKIDEKYLRKVEIKLPEVSELDVIRHYINLSKLNFSVDTEFYPLGSCTMKYNPKICEKLSAKEEFLNLHPYLSYIDEESVQGALEVIYETSKLLCEITGMEKITTQPYAGAHGELTGVLMMAAYHRSKGKNKKYIIIPDSAHGTNPASAAMAGYSIISIPVDTEGNMDINILKEKMNDEVAGIMMTVPSTLGLFEKNIKEIIETAHKYDALMYYDGANLNAILGKVKPGEIGFDIVHINLHKTFSTPHGGGGPGAGVVGVSKRLVDFIPVPEVIMENEKFKLNFNIKNTIGAIASFFGNFQVLLKAYIYILLLGKQGLTQVSEIAVLNANYVLAKLRKFYKIPYDRICMHEFVMSAENQLKKGVHAIDIAKFLIDNKIHPPTVYFPLVVNEAIMIEPTETESKQTLDQFIDIMIKVAEISEKEPGKIMSAPVNTTISRPDETKAAKELKLTCDI